MSTQICETVVTAILTHVCLVSISWSWVQVTCNTSVTYMVSCKSRERWWSTALKHHSPFKISSQRRSDVRLWSQRWKAYIKKVHMTPASPSADHSSLLIHTTWAPTILNRSASAGNCTVIQYLHRRGEENVVPGSMLLLSTSIDKCVLKHKIHWPAIMMMVDTELQWFAFYSWCFRDQFGG